MPGYNKERFVELTPKMKDQYTCGICKEVLNGPTATPCCGRHFCADCITKWSDTNLNCHNCSRPLLANQLVALRSMADIVANFQVTCRHAEEGCGHVCPLDVEPSHVRNDCQYNRERHCGECGAMKKLDAEHSCVQHLREQLDTNTERGLNEITGLKNALDEMRSEMARLKVDKLDKKDRLPIGYIVLQLPGQESPEELWPDLEWQNVSSEYSGDFFRVEGGNSEPFGTVQEQQGRTMNIRSYYTLQSEDPFIDTSISDSNPYVKLMTGCFDVLSELSSVYEVTLSYDPDEIRPRNKAVRVWKRID